MTIAERINGERLATLGWGRAILMQLAHPLVAAGVAEHSTFRDRPRSRYQRLHSTLQSMLALTFGPPAERRAAIDHINAIHDRVHGVLPVSAGRFAAGTTYTATDPALLVWVDATLRQSMPDAYELFVEPLTVSERDAYCAEGDDVMEQLRIPAGARPHTSAELERYIDAMTRRGEIAVTAVARELAGEVLNPPYSTWLWPAAEVNRLATVGLLSQELREAYGFSWSAADAERLKRWARRIRGARRWCPDAVARWRTAPTE